MAKGNRWDRMKRAGFVLVARNPALVTTILRGEYAVDTIHPIPVDKRFKDETGKRYGMWTVLGHAGIVRRTHAFRCRCDCGSERAVLGNKLRAGETAGCGCIRRDSLNGKRFGRLLVVEKNGTYRHTDKYRCVCDCGNETTVVSTRLRNGNTRSCGCLHGSKIVGAKIGRWTVISIEKAVKVDRPNPKAFCRCDCGTEAMVQVGNLYGRTSGSCGCLQRELAAAAMTTHGRSAAGVDLPEWGIYCGMVRRCHEEKNARYSDRGIAVCGRWRSSFDDFLADMGRRPSEKHSIDRIDNDGNYEPGNCRWATAEEQAHNKSNNRNFTLDGQTKCLSVWARELGISVVTLSARIDRGWDLRRALTTRKST